MQPNQTQEKQPEQVTIVSVTPTPTKSDTAKVASLVGIFVVLVAAMALTVFIIPRGVNYLASVSFSSIFKPNDKISVSADKTRIVSGESVTVVWNGPVHNDGIYSASYPCKNGITATFHSGQKMECEKPFFFTSPDNSFTLSFKTTSSRDTDMPVYINYKDTTDKTSIIGDVLVAVLAAGTAPTPSTSVISNPVNTSTVPVVTVTSPTQTTTAPSHTTASYVDLVVRVIEVGSINSTNTFIPGPASDPSNRPAVHFEVRNIGTGISRPWTLKAILPSKSTPVYQSPAEPSLAPNDRVELTLGFDTVAQGGEVIISVNDNHSVIESNYTNNIINYRVQGTGITSGTTVPVTSNGTDLAIRIDAIGYLNNGAFTPANQISRTQRAAIQFTVMNIGTQASGPWTFGATLPSTSNPSYASAANTSIAPGMSTQFTISFDNLQSIGNNTATITIDPNNSLGESNRTNNSAPVVIVGQ